MFFRKAAKLWSSRTVSSFGCNVRKTILNTGHKCYEFERLLRGPKRNFCSMLKKFDMTLEDEHNVRDEDLEVSKLRDQQLFNEQKIETLLGLRGLRGISDFKRLEELAMDRCMKLRDKIVKGCQLPKLSAETSIKKKDIKMAKYILFLTDEISNELCLFLDAMEFIRCNHPSDKIRSAANQSLLRFSQILHVLNTDVPLHKRMKQIVDSEVIMNNLTEAERNACIALTKDMEKNGGVHDLSEDGSGEKKNKRIQLSSTIDHYIAEFHEVLSKDRHREDSDSYSMDELIYIPKELEESIPPSVDIEWVSNSDKEIPKFGVVYPDSFGTLLAYCAVGEIRKQAYIRINSSNPECLQIIDKLANTRHELARELKKESYSHIFTSENMIGTPENVVRFLENLNTLVKPKAKDEIEMLRDLKKIHEPNNNPDTIFDWDRDFYKRKLLKQLFNQETTSSLIKPYLTLENAFAGFQYICKQVFGIEFELLQPSRSELWHGSILKYAVHRENEGLLGFLYLDLYQRDFKRNIAANFTIQCSKKIINQKPIASLSCTFQSNPNRYTTTNNPFDSKHPLHSFVEFSRKHRIDSCLLSFSELTTFFHELGHALHVLLGRTDFQCTSGTRTALDFVETPSQFMENFAYDTRILQLFAIHHQTGQALPMEYFEKMKSSQNLLAALELEDQILLALFDIIFYGSPQFEKHDRKSAVRIFEELKNKYTSVPFTKGTSYPGKFEHLTNYGSGYYSYLYSNVLSSHIWEKWFSANPLNREAGERYVRDVLSPGGSVDASILMNNILEEEEPDPSFMLKRLGIVRD